MQVNFFVPTVWVEFAFVHFAPDLALLAAIIGPGTLKVSTVKVAIEANLFTRIPRTILFPDQTFNGPGLKYTLVSIAYTPTKLSDGFVLG